jgi:DNA (cytosine-5)-methyltransferase 1
MKHGSLFSGIGGFDLAADWMGWENIFHCEIAEFPRKILNHYWPNADCHEDIKKTDFTKYCGTVDIISGGFPCQPYSAAGKRLGKEDDRHLWPEMLRVIREVKPQWVVGENVRGLLNWNGGMVFHEVCADLENIGYEVQAFIIPASGINAPHQRERLWIVAHSINGGYSTRREQNAEKDRLQEQYRSEMDCREFNRTSVSSITANTDSNECNKQGQSINGREINKFEDRNKIWDNFNTDGKQRNAPDTDLHGLHKRNGNNEINSSERGFNALNDIDQSNGIGNAPDTESQRTREQSSENRGREDGRFNDISKNGNVADTNSIGLEGQRRPIGELEREIRFSSTSSRNMYDTAWDNFPTKSPVCSGNDGISHGLDNITFSKWRNESIKGYGNAVVPQVVYRIFKTIEYIQNLNDNTKSKN